MLDLCYNETKLHSGEAATKRDRNIRYLLSLKNENLLLPFKFEAGLFNGNSKKSDFHWGWDSPLSQIRGTFTGHFLSACALIYSNTGNEELKVKADKVVSEIKKCQEENGGQWAFAIPEKYLHWLKKGKRTWAPQYVCHKLMMGLFDMYRYAENQTAMKILEGCTEWFYNFTNDITRENMDEMMDLEETGAMMEFWADIYGTTKDKKHLELMKRYERPNLFEPLLKGIDVLTNIHANSTVPEIHGAARAYEVTGEKRYRKIVENYWDLAVEKRGMFVTGGQTAGEVWTPLQEQSARLNDRNQEHCVVYNMMRLSQYLYRWTKETKYADYWEQNLHNGIFAQGYWEERGTWMNNEDLPRKKGHVIYYLPLEAGGEKLWGSETNHFWCCHCTLVQANANFHEAIYYKEKNEIYIAQYLPSELKTKIDETEIIISQRINAQSGAMPRIIEVDRTVLDRPKNNKIIFKIKGAGKHFTLKFRKPWWLAGKMTVSLKNKIIKGIDKNGYLSLTRKWGDDELEITLPKELRRWKLADRPDTIAFIDGPVALCGLTDEQRTIYGDAENPESFLVPDNERIWLQWLGGYRTVDQPVNFRFVPIKEIGYEKYTVYFQCKKRRTAL